MRSVSFWGKFTSGSRISASRSDLLKVPSMSTVQRHHSICELIEESLIGSVAVLEQESQHKDTLQVTEARQYRERGLVHIEDAVYRFFMFLEKQRVHLLNDGMLRIEGANMVEEAC